MIMDRKKLRIFLVTLSIASFLFGCSKGSATLGGAGESPINQSLIFSDPALAMVERFNMGSNLERLAIQVAKSTHTYGVVVEKYGASNAQSVVAQEIQKLIPEYQPRWNKNLASAYSSHLSHDELRSLATDGKKSPYVSKLLTSQASTGEDMKNSSMPILTELVTKALSNAIK
jgi:hypothetical protein